MNTRKLRLQHLIAQYELRRREMRKKYGAKTESYTTASKIIRRKLKNWRKQLKRILQHEEYYNEVHKLICEYTGVEEFRWQVKTNQHTNQIKLCKYLMCKYVLETKNYRGSYLSEYLGTTHKEYAGEARLKFTRKLHIKQNRELWQGFKRFADDYFANK